MEEPGYRRGIARREYRRGIARREYRWGVARREYLFEIFFYLEPVCAGDFDLLLLSLAPGVSISYFLLFRACFRQRFGFTSSFSRAGSIYFIFSSI